MPGRSDADADFASRHGGIYLFLAFDLFLVSLFSGLPGLGLFQPFELRGREKDQENDDGAEEGNQHQTQIADMRAENLSFLFGFVARRGLHQGVLSRHPGKAKTQLG
jgi:hypothetical protein